MHSSFFILFSKLRMMSKQYMSLILVVVFLFGFVKSDTDKDKEKCANQLIGLATCLPYVSGEANTSPPLDCCIGLKQVLQKSPECLCLLVKDRNDPSLGLQINATRALGLPAKCNAPAASISNCPALLHLPSNSPDAKVFEDFANSGNKSHAIAPALAVLANSSSERRPTSDGGKIRKKWPDIEIISGLLLSMVLVLCSTIVC